MNRPGPCRWLPALVLAAACLTGCSGSFEPDLPPLREHPPAPFEAWPAAPPDNPTTAPKVALGWQLFHDPRLSASGEVACVDCHLPERAFGGADAVSFGVGGARSRRHSPSLVNVGYWASQFWDGRAPDLEAQATAVLLEPSEMAIAPEVLERRLAAIPGYRRQFREVFGVDRPGVGEVARALAAFERRLVSGDSAWDRHRAGAVAMSAAAQRGESLFFGRAGCASCHPAPLFSDAPDGGFHALGVGGSREPADPGRAGVTGRESDRGAFKTPGLRDVARSAPYLHDGSLLGLWQVVELYEHGGAAGGPRDPRLTTLYLSIADKGDLVAFLEALTGTLPEWTSRAPRLPPGPDGG